MYCSKRMSRLFGHVNCREHADCGMKSQKYGLYWSPGKCDICRSLLDACEAETTKVQALADLKVWVQGFAKLIKPECWEGPKAYLPKEEMRVLLFPRADKNVVIGRLDEGGLTGQFLSPGNASTSQAVGGGLLHPSQVVESMDTDDDLTPTNSPSPVVPPPKTQAGDQSSLLLELLQQIKEMKQGQLEMGRKVQELSQAGPSSASSVAWVDPLKVSLPKELEGNPWRHCGNFYLKHGQVFMSETSYYALERLEFHPDFTAWPNCYARFRDSAFSGLKIPQETVLLSHTEANAQVAKLAASLDHSMSDKGALGSSDPVFILSESVVPPFLGKISKSVLESFEGRKDAFRGLKEIKPFSLLVPSKSDTFPELENFSSIFQEERLRADVADIQLKESFPKLTKGLIDAEFKARVRLGSVTTLQLMIETAQSLDKSFPLGAAMAKLHATTFGEALEAFIKARRDCRRHVVGSARNDHDTSP